MPVGAVGSLIVPRLATPERRTRSSRPAQAGLSGRFEFDEHAAEEHAADVAAVEAAIAEAHREQSIRRPGRAAADDD
jgi:hypothetical protein